MHRSLFPFILASLGYYMFLIVVDMPLLEWHISNLVTDLSSTYDYHISRSPWITYIGDALDDGSYILRDVVDVSGNGGMCDKDNLKFAVRRSRNDELVERILNINLKNNSLLFKWGVIELIIAGTYIWWFIIEYKHGSDSQIFIFTSVAVLICIFLILSSRIVGPRLPYPEIAADCYGTISFDAEILKIHYETLLVFFIAIIAEIGAVSVMLRQIRKAISERKAIC